MNLRRLKLILCSLGIHGGYRYHQLTYDGLYEWRCKDCGRSA